MSGLSAARRAAALAWASMGFQYQLPFLSRWGFGAGDEQSVAVVDVLAVELAGDFGAGVDWRRAASRSQAGRIPVV